MQSPADWQLPPGVNRGLWDYLHSAEVADGYDDRLAGSSLFTADVRFVAERCPRPGRLLDLGCGTGRLLVPMARAGHEVVGVDLSQEMLRVARRKAEQAGVRIGLACLNLTDLSALADGRFDYTVCLFSTLGMVLGAEMRRRAVAEALRVLRPGGRFILHVHNYWFNAWDRGGRRWLLRDLFRRGPGQGDRPMPPHQGVAGLSLHHFTRGEATRLLRGAGFRVTEVRPLSLRADGRLPCPWWFGWLRAYGYLVVADRPEGR